MHCQTVNCLTTGGQKILICLWEEDFLSITWEQFKTINTFVKNRQIGGLWHFHYLFVSSQLCHGHCIFWNTKIVVDKITLHFLIWSAFALNIYIFPSSSLASSESRSPPISSPWKYLVNRDRTLSAQLGVSSASPGSSASLLTATTLPTTQFASLHASMWDLKVGTCYASIDLKLKDPKA